MRFPFFMRQQYTPSKEKPIIMLQRQTQHAERLQHDDTQSDAGTALKKARQLPSLQIRIISN